MKILAWLLIIAGVVMIATNGFNYKEKKKVIDTDVIDISTTENKTVTWPWYAGAVSIIGGIVILVAADRKGRR